MGFKNGHLTTGSVGGSVWTSGATYAQNDIVIQSGYPILCLANHTSGVYATDVQSGYWQMLYPAKNNLINSNMEISQRGTSTANISGGTIAYPTDRWRLLNLYSGSIMQCSQIDLGTAGPVNSRFAAQCNHTGTPTDTGRIWLTYTLEKLDTQKIANRVMTISFWARGTTSNTNALRLNVYYNTTEVSVTNGSPEITNLQKPLTTTWTKYQITFTVPSISVLTVSGVLGFIFIPSNATSEANGDGFQITQVMLNEGPAPAAFQTAGANIQAELAMCQRYYEKSFDLATAPAGGISANAQFQYINASGQGFDSALTVEFKATKRVPVWVIFYPTKAGNDAGYITEASSTSNRAVDTSFIKTSVGGSTYMRSVSGTFLAGIASYHWTADAEL